MPETGIRCHVVDSGIITPDVQRPTTSNAEFEKDIDNDAEKSDIDYIVEPESADIVFHYLTFATELPQPTNIYPSDGQGPAPEPPNLVRFTSPFEWSKSRKNITVWISCAVTVLTAYTAGSLSPGIEQMQKEWGVSSVAALVGITVFTCGKSCLCWCSPWANYFSGFAIAPMVLAPFSEINGRRPVFLISGLLFVICQLCTGLTRSYAGMLLARFFVGIGGSTFSTMGRDVTPIGIFR